MSDIILKIYSSSGGWANTLDHEISGEIPNYTIVDNCNFLIDTGSFLIDNSAHQYEDDIVVDDGSTTQVWRAHAMDGTLINSGVITSVEKAGPNLLVKGRGMSELLRRKIIESESFYSKDGAGNAMQGKYILTDATYGLVKKYLSTTYGAINVLASGAGGYVDTPLTTQTLQDKIDGITLWDACILVAKASYGRTGEATDNVYDAYLFETYSAGAYALNFWFREREVYPTSGITRFGPSDIYMPGLKYSPSTLQKYNKVFVRGANNTISPCPGDKDEWTESTTNWTVNADATLQLSSICRFGSNAIGLYADPGPPSFIWMRYDPSTSIVDNRYYQLNFLAIAKHAEDSDDILNYKIVLTVEDKYGNEDTINYDLQIASMAYSTTLKNGVIDIGFQSFPIHLPTPENTHGWGLVDGSTFPISGIPVAEWEHITKIQFYFDTDDTANDEDIYWFIVDQLHFLGNVPYSGSAISGAPTYLKEYIHTNRGLHSDTICGNMAEQLLRAFKNTQYPAEVSLLGYHRDFSLKSGLNIELQIPEKGINAIAGQTPAKLPIQSITYTPNKQHLRLGRHISLGEIINDAKRSIKGIDKIQ